MDFVRYSVRFSHLSQAVQENFASCKPSIFTLGRIFDTHGEDVSGRNSDRDIYALRESWEAGLLKIKIRLDRVIGVYRAVRDVGGIRDVKNYERVYYLRSSSDSRSAARVAQSGRDP